MAAPTPSKPRVFEIKNKLLRPALTSHYVAHINAAVIKGRAGKFFTDRQANIDDDLISLSCSEASLPGSSLSTNEINDDYTGVTERHAYRRLYDNSMDLTFYVDHDHTIIKFFETWISWIVREDQYSQQINSNYYYRVRYPNDYRVEMSIQKFERDYTRYSTYTFVDAYPSSITSMPISYDSSSLLKCTVSFTYTRYFMGNSVKISNTTESTPLTTPVTLYGLRPNGIPQTVQLEQFSSDSTGPQSILGQFNSTI